MKFVVYWAMYFSTLGDAEIAGAIAITTDDHLISYVYPYEYLEWDIIDRKEIDTTNECGGKELVSATYFLRRKGVNSVLVITGQRITHYISTEPAVNIQMIRKPLHTCRTK